MRLTKKWTGVAAGGLLLAFAAAGPAAADSNVGSDTTFAGMGSDTSQDVVEGLSNAITIGGAPVLSNYKAQPVGRTVVTRTANAANCTFTVSKNSGEGRDALSAAMRGATYAGSPAVAGGAVVTSANMTNCVNFARSSSGGNPTTSPGIGTMTYVPFATDSLSYATLSVSSVPHTMNLSTLKALYSANGTPGTAACGSRAPLLPSFGSGTRSFFVANILGLADTVIPAPGGTVNPLGTCVRDTDAAGTPIQEHVGTFLTAGNQLLPFSTAQWITQNSGQLIASQLGRATLGSIDWDNGNGATYKSPLALQSAFTGTAAGVGGTRPLYNVVPTQQINNSFTPPTGSSQIALTFQQNLYDTFVGPFNPDGSPNAAHASLVCSQTTVLSQYGLAPWGACGDTAKRNTN